MDLDTRRTLKSSRFVHFDREDRKLNDYGRLGSSVPQPNKPVDAPEPSWPEMANQDMDIVLAPQIYKPSPPLAVFRVGHWHLFTRPGPGHRLKQFRLTKNRNALAERMFGERERERKKETHHSLLNVHDKRVSITSEWALSKPIYNPKIF